MSHIKGFFKKITGETAAYDALTKQPIVDAELKLNLFKEVTSISINGLDTYVKYMSKQIDMQLAEKFIECRNLFEKYEQKGAQLNPSIAHVLGIVFGRLVEIQQGISDEIRELTKNIEVNILKPLNDYQREISTVKDNRKELKDAYDRIEQCRQSLEKAKKEYENVQRTSSSASRLTMMGTSDTSKRINDLNRLEEKVQRIEKELDEANLTANEKYDKYTEGLFKRVAEECDLTNYFLEYLKLQKKYHKQSLKRLDQQIPGVKESLSNYNKKPVFGCSLSEYVNMSNSNASFTSSTNSVSPVVRKLIESMCKQNVFNEEGIFRIAGSRIKMNCLLYAINAGYIDYLDTDNYFDVHCLAGVLKQYIRELPDSILCNELYDSWLNAINTPMPNKIEAFRGVLQKLPKANYENLKYLIKFLAKIVENSERTKMTTQNMGICFGVSLTGVNSNTIKSSGSINSLSSASVSQFSSLSSAQENSNYSGRPIDMTTAANIFDFLLTNHYDLFPGEISFTSGSSLTTKQSFYQASNKISSIQSGDQTNPHLKSKDLNSSVNESYQGHNSNTNRYSVMVNDSVNSLNDTPSQNSPFSKISSNNTSFNTSVQSPSNSSITHVNRHVKNNSMDIKFIDQNYDLNSNFNHANRIFPPLSSQTNNSNSNASLDSGSSSPKLKGKKQAPAPPKVPNSNEPSQSNLQMTSPIPSVSELPNDEVGFSSSKNSLANNSETSISSTVSTSSTSNPNNLINKLNNTNQMSSNGTNPTLPMRSFSFKAHEQSSKASSTAIEKPNQPPPQVPIRTHIIQQQAPPPIGFNVQINTQESPNSSFIQNDSPPYPISKTDHVKPISILSTTSSTTSLSQDQLSSPNNTLNKPPKPALPRRPGNMVATHLNKFERRSEEECIETIDDQPSKSASEVTSL